MARAQTMLSRRRALRVASALALAPTLQACSPPLPPMRVGSIVFPGYEFIFLAREMGWLDERQVRLVELLSNTDVLRALAAGQLEAAQLTLDEVLSARADGIDLKVVLILDVSDGADVVLARPPLTLRQLEGRRIAVEDSAGGAIMLSAVLAAAGLRVEQVSKVSYTLDRSVDFYQQKRADFVITVPPWAGQMEQLGAQRVFDSRKIPDRIVDVLAVRADAASRYGAAIRALVHAHFRALEHWGRQPEAAAKLIAPRMQLPAAEVGPVFQGLQFPGVQDNREWMARDGRLARVLDDLQRSMLQDALLKRKLSAADLTVSTFLPE